MDTIIDILEAEISQLARKPIWDDTDHQAIKLLMHIKYQIAVLESLMITQI